MPLLERPRPPRWVSSVVCPSHGKGRVSRKGPGGRDTRQPPGVGSHPHNRTLPSPRFHCGRVAVAGGPTGPGKASPARPICPASAIAKTKGIQTSFGLQFLLTSVHALSRAGSQGQAGVCVAGNPAVPPGGTTTGKPFKDNETPGCVPNRAAAEVPVEAAASLHRARAVPAGGRARPGPLGPDSEGSGSVSFFPGGNKAVTPHPPCLSKMPRANTTAKPLSFMKPPSPFSGCFQTDGGALDPPEKHGDHSVHDIHDQTPLRRAALGVERRLTPEEPPGPPGMAPPSVPRVKAG